jgi:hypothetical protein
MLATCRQHITTTNTCLSTLRRHKANMSASDMSARHQWYLCQQLLVLCCQHVGQHVSNMLPRQTHVSHFDPHFDTPSSNFASKDKDHDNKPGGGVLALAAGMV